MVAPESTVPTKGKATAAAKAATAALALRGALEARVATAARVLCKVVRAAPEGMVEMAGPSTALGAMVGTEVPETETERAAAEETEATAVVPAEKAAMVATVETGEMDTCFRGRAVTPVLAIHPETREIQRRNNRSFNCLGQRE